MYSCTVTDQYNYTSIHHDILLYPLPQVRMKRLYFPIVINTLNTICELLIF